MAASVRRFGGRAPGAGGGALAGEGGGGPFIAQRGLAGATEQASPSAHATAAISQTRRAQISKADNRGPPTPWSAIPSALPWHRTLRTRPRSRRIFAPRGG